MKRFGCAVAGFLLMGTSAASAAQEEQTPASPPPVQSAYGPYLGGRMALFEPFIGAWVPVGGAFADNPTLADFYGELYEWSLNGATVRLYEIIHRTDRQRGMFEGFVYWDPLDERFEFVGL